MNVPVFLVHGSVMVPRWRVATRNAWRKIEETLT